MPVRQGAKATTNILKISKLTGKSLNN